MNLQWPVDRKYPITFKFGAAPSWYTNVFGYPHNGVDIGTPVGTPIFATDDGVVMYADDVPDTDGKGTILRHDWGRSYYWHLQTLIAREGDKVKKGDLIAYSGATGFATGPHLHFALMVWSMPDPSMHGYTDPEKLIPLSQGEVPAPVPTYRTYFVLPGDSLWKIAIKFYGNGAKWATIFEANRDQISDPSIIRIAQKLRIP